MNKTDNTEVKPKWNRQKYQNSRCKAALQPISLFMRSEKNKQTKNVCPGESVTVKTVQLKQTNAFFQCSAYFFKFFPHQEQNENDETSRPVSVLVFCGR